MNLFQANLVAFGDRAGLGAYEVGHFLQHQQYLRILAGSGSNIPDYNILNMQCIDADGAFNANEFMNWLQAHEAIHEFLRANANVSGSNLGFFDPESPEEFAVWQEQHRFEHGQFDVHFGTT